MASTNHSSSDSNSSSNGNACTRQHPRDAFLFYSNPENLEKALNLEDVDYRNEDTSITRKTRISFEKHSLSLMSDFLFDDVDFETDDESDLDVVGILQAFDSRQMQRPRDAFLFYSNPENLRRRRNFEEVDYNNEDASFAKKTRISFEQDAFSLVAEGLMDGELDIDGVDVPDFLRGDNPVADDNESA